MGSSRKTTAGSFSPLLLWRLSKAQSGQIFLQNEASWLEQLELELFSFPLGRYDDQIDSISQALAYEMNTYEWTDDALSGLGRLVGGPLFGYLQGY